MFEHKKLQSLEDYFKELNTRPAQCVYFTRINGNSPEVTRFLMRYYQAARLSGTVIEGKIPNPTEANLAYYGEIMGMGFQMAPAFFTASLKKWLPRMNDYQRQTVVQALYATLDAMRQEGKNENMLRNAYIKFMCWLYYKFERIVSQLGENSVPKLLYQGEVSNYELKLLSILSCAGCDVVLLQCRGDAGYLKLDPASRWSDALPETGLTAFPEGFSIKTLQQELTRQQNEARLYGTRPQLQRCTNAWIEGKGLADCLIPPAARGDDPKLFYNCFCRISGVEDKLTYLNELYQFQLKLKTAGRKLLILEQTIPVATMDEISQINRKPYRDQEQMLLDLSGKLTASNVELQRLLRQAYLDVLLEESRLPGINQNKLTNKAVYLLCWLRRYQSDLFAAWKPPELACAIYLGGCQNENEAMLLRCLARLPTDVLVLVPDLNKSCCLAAPELYQLHFQQSLSVPHFPRENADLHMGTTAYHAERELDTLLYQDSGMYRAQQYSKAVSVSLQTMYEEIAILWDQEVKYRPNFSVVEGVVNLPVLFAKVCGVKDGQVNPYWASIQALKTEDTILVTQPPLLRADAPNPMRMHATGFFKNGRLQRAKIKEHPSYQYGFLRAEVQEHILDKLQLLIQQRTIRGTFENGTEYTIISTVLNMNKDLLRLLQKFDFTRKNPKLIYIMPDERILSLEDTILTAFLNLSGFDVLFFVPTGYQSVEKYFAKPVFEEHQLGEYLYDLHTPDFTQPLAGGRKGWREKLFRRGV